MKKLLSALLAVVLCFGGAVCASAALPAPGLQLTPALQFELPVVTAIEAEWNGEVLLYGWLEPYFSPDNVTVTAYFGEGEPEVLTHWNASSPEWFWYVIYEYDWDANSVTILYMDSNLTDTDAVDLPQASFDFPENYLKLFAEAQEAILLKLGEASPVAPGRMQSFTLFSFTPAKSGTYQFLAGDEWQYDRVFFIRDADMNEIVSGNTGPVLSLEAGKTYYAFVFNYSDSDYSVTITEYSRWKSFFSNFGYKFFDAILTIYMLPILLPLAIWQWIAMLFS
ncbi:MAG: hypothetical protein FWE98_00540 [Oscillospiraceae bacterium]|nr:hypothetical protein [Oscillospiraceae bacterium]